VRRVHARATPTCGREKAANTGDKLRSSIACAGFVCFIPLFDAAEIPTT